MTQSHRQELLENLLENTATFKRSLNAYAHGLYPKTQLSQAQIELLFAIRHSQPVSFKDLAKQLCLTPGAISQSADGLEEHGYITRLAGEHDRRVQCLQLSKKGGRLLRDVERKRQHFMEMLAADLTDDELAMWLHVQTKMIARLQAGANQKEEA